MKTRYSRSQCRLITASVLHGNLDQTPLNRRHGGLQIALEARLYVADVSDEWIEVDRDGAIR